MPTKHEFVYGFLKAGDIDIEPGTVEEATVDWFMNIRKNGGLRLTEMGCQYLVTKLNLKCYDIQIPRTVKLTMKRILILDNFLRCPYYLNLKKHLIIVFGQHQASELIIYGNDLIQFFENYEIDG